MMSDQIKQTTTEINTACFEALAVGQSYQSFNQVTEADVIKYAEISGDVNPIHLDPVYAKESIFGERIAHGMLTAGYISAIFGTKMPGAGCIFLSQSMRFKAPVKINDRVETIVTVSALNDQRNHVTFDCECRVGDTVVLTGEALLKVPSAEKTTAV